MRTGAVVRRKGRAGAMEAMSLPVWEEGVLPWPQVPHFEGPPVQGASMINRRDCKSAFEGSMGEIGYDASNDTEVRSR